MSGLGSALPERPSRREVRHILERHALVARERLRHIHQSATHEQRCFLELFPLLLHVNHPALPGFNGAETPAGIAGYEPDRQALLLARRHARSLKAERRPQRVPPIQGLYLIGSSGTLGQDAHSDYDIWVCHHPDLGGPEVERLQEKAQMLEAHAATLGLQMHLFVFAADDFRQGRNSRISDESSGNTQHLLLLEEFYRSGLLLAGRPPLWWLVPPEYLHDYAAYCEHMLGKRLIRAADWLDFGGLTRITLGEFFSAAHWQLFKGIQVPYKSLLKLLLFEHYASTFPDIRWLAEETQERFHAETPIDAEAVDPYLLLMRRIEGHLAGPSQTERLELARRAFYLKSGVRLGVRGPESWKTGIMRRLVREWGWGEGELINLDSHREWKLPKVVEERNLLVGELSHSYRLLTGLARRHDATAEIDMRELSLLGRKLFAALERRPGKIDRINPGISDDLHEPRVWLRRHPRGDAWQCFLAPPEEGASAARSARGVTELLTWLIANGVVDTSTHIDLPPEIGASQEHLRLVRLLQRHFPPSDCPAAPLERFAGAPRGERALVVANALQPVDPDPDSVLVVSQRADALSFGSARVNLIETVDHICTNSWGELQVGHHRGTEGLLEMACQHLALFVDAPEAPPPVCHCDTPGHGTLIAQRLARLLHDLVAHFRRHGPRARYLLLVEDRFHLLECHRRQYRHLAIGGLPDLLEYLGQPEEPFRPTEIDDTGLRDSPLPLLVRINQPGRTQLVYRVEREGIRAYLLDAGGALLEQWLPGASEGHFLVQQQRFFETVQEWRQGIGEAPGVSFLRIEREGDDWHVRRSRPPATANDEGTELILCTGPRGPWRDDFSLLSGGHEFSSAALGDRVYREAARFLLGLRRGRRRYPLYLTGVLPGDGLSGPLSELVRFKAHVERRLREAAEALPESLPRV